MPEHLSSYQKRAPAEALLVHIILHLRCGICDSLRVYTSVRAMPCIACLLLVVIFAFLCLIARFFFGVLCRLFRCLCVLLLLCCRSLCFKRRRDVLRRFLRVLYAIVSCFLQLRRSFRVLL